MSYQNNYQNNQNDGAMGWDEEIGFHRERTDLILFLTSLLEHDKTDSEHKEHRQHHEIQFSPNFGFRFLYFQHR